MSLLSAATPFVSTYAAAAGEDAGFPKILGPSRHIGSSGGGPLDAELFHPRLERGGLESEQAGGALGPAHAPAFLLEHGEDVLPFDVFQAQEPGFAGGGLAGGPVTQLERRSLRDNERALDDVAQLANVPRPVVGHEGVECALGDSLDPFAELDAVLHGEVSDEQRDVLLAIA